MKLLLPLFIGLAFACRSVAQDAPARFKNAAAADKTISAMPSAQWWSIFHDHTLDALENQALAANQDLWQAVARVIEAREQTAAAAADFYPHLEALADATRRRTTNTAAPQLGRFVGPLPATTGSSQITSLFSQVLATQPLSTTYNDFRLPLQLTYEFDVFGRIRASYGQAHANAQAAEADRQAVELSLTAQVATGYFDLRGLDSQVAVLRRTLALRLDAFKLQKDRFVAGVANKLDLARAQAEYDNTEADLDGALRQRGEAENALAALCGQYASDFKMPERPLVDALPSAPAAVSATLLAQRPDVREAERRMVAALQEVRAARAEMLPMFNIEGDAGYESGRFNQLVEDQSHTWQAVFEVQVPIFEGGRNVANLRAAHARQQEAVAAWRQTAITAFKEVENALVDLHQRAAEFDARSRAVADAGTVFKLSQQRYLEGEVSYFDVIDAERQLQGDELDRVQTLNARYDATADLVRALGGSW